MRAGAVAVIGNCRRRTSIQALTLSGSILGGDEQPRPDRPRQAGPSVRCSLCRFSTGPYAAPRWRRSGPLRRRRSSTIRRRRSTAMKEVETVVSAYVRAKDRRACRPCQERRGMVMCDRSVGATSIGRARESLLDLPRSVERSFFTSEDFLCRRSNARAGHLLHPTEARRSGGWWAACAAKRIPERLLGSKPDTTLAVPWFPVLFIGAIAHRAGRARASNFGTERLMLLAFPLPRGTEEDQDHVLSWNAGARSRCRSRLRGPGPGRRRLARRLIGRPGARSSTSMPRGRRTNGGWRIGRPCPPSSRPTSRPAARTRATPSPGPRRTQVLPGRG